MSIFNFIKKEKKEDAKNGEEKKQKAPEAREKKVDSVVAAIKDSHSKILVRPHVTEKSSNAKIQNKYVVEVDPGANVIEVKKAIQNLFHVEPIKINSMTIRGKVRRFGRFFGTTKNRKKVIITLKEGQKIDLGEGK